MATVTFQHEKYPRGEWLHTYDYDTKQMMDHSTGQWFNGWSGEEVDEKFTKGVWIPDQTQDGTEVE